MQTPPDSATPLTVFASYAEKDGELYEELRNHRSLPQRLGQIQNHETLPAICVSALHLNTHGRSGLDGQKRIFRLKLR